MDVTDIITRLVPELHSDTVNNLTFWSECELLTWCDEAAKRLARITGLFVERDTASITLVAGTAKYNLPARHVATLFVMLDDKPLIPRSTKQLEANDPNWENTLQGTPEFWAEDKEGIGKLILYPPPDPPAQSMEVEIVMLVSPVTLDCPKMNTAIVMPTPVDDYLHCFAQGRAWSKESDVRLPEVGNHLAQRAALYEQIIQKYWGAD